MATNTNNTASSTNSAPQKYLVEILDTITNQIKGKKTSTTRAVLDLFESLDKDLRSSDRERFKQIVSDIRSRLGKYTYVVSDDEGTIDQIIAVLNDAFRAIKASHSKRHKTRKDLADFADRAFAAEQEELAEQSNVRINFTKQSVTEELQQGIKRERTLQQELHSELMSKWYSRIHQNMIDLVADFGATELFFIDGDSLLFEMAADENLDWSHGGQLLHLVYLVESFLSGLHDRGCVFQLIFFRDHRSIWEDSPSRLLAREAIVHHLVSNTKFEICLQFDNWWSADWTRYMQEQQPAFIMLSDGEPCTRGGANLLSAIIFKTFIIHLTHHRQNCALFSNLTFRDSKILSFVVQRRAYNSALVRQLLDALIPLCSHSVQRFHKEETQLGDVLAVNGSRLNAEAVLKHLTTTTTTTTTSSSETQDLRLATTIAALARVLREDPSLAALAKLFLVHTVLLRHISIKSRALQLSQWFDGHSDTVGRFVGLVQQHMVFAMPSIQAQSTPSSCNLFDLLDGRLFYKIVALMAVKDQFAAHTRLGLNDALFDEVSAAWNTICEFVPNATIPFVPLLNNGEALLSGRVNDAVEETSSSSVDSSVDVVLHIRNDFINQQLDQQLHLPEIEPDESVVLNFNSTEIPFPKGADVGLIHNLNEKAILFPHKPDPIRRNQQRYYTFLHQYASSLQGIEALHRPLVVSTGHTASAEEAPAKKISKKAQEIIERNKSEQEEKALRAHKEKMKNLIEATKKESSIESMLSYLDKYIAFEGHPKIVLRAQLFRLDLLIRQWNSDISRRSDRAAIIFRLVHDIFNYCKPVLSERKLRLLITPIVMMGFSAQALKMAEEAIAVMPPPKEKTPKKGAKKGAKKGSSKAPPTIDAAAIVQKIADTMRELKEVDEKTRRPDELSYARFQLTHCGHLMERDVDQKADPRVLFKPDEWQRQLLDVVDSDECALVVAPTSSGKTFAAYYAMDRVLRTSDTGVVVYVAPTKALVNQVAAEVYGRFSHKKTAPGSTIFGIYTKEYKINPNTCQILITLPEILEVLVLSPDPETQEWTKRIKFVIFDEIHCIGDLDGGSVWEHLLLLVRCPFIALSATVGNPEEFRDWLAKSQAKRNREVRLVVYNQRWSDLQKYVYLPIAAPAPLTTITPLPNKIDGSTLVTLHPYSALTLAKLQRFGVPVDMSLTPAEVMQLVDAMFTVASRKNVTDMEEIAKYDPDRYYENVLCIKKKDVRELEKALRELIQRWASKKPDVIKEVIHFLDSNITSRFTAMENASASEDKMECYNKDFLQRNFLNLVATLAAQDKLPALVFSFERNICETLVTHAVQELERLESDKREGTEEARIEYHRLVKRKEKEIERKRKERERALKDMTKEQKQMALERGDLLEEVEEAEEPMDQDFTLIKDGDGIGKFGIRDVLRDLRRRMDPKWDVLIRGLERGFGVHHAGMPKKYREAVETLFRLKQLKVVVSTSTLALGINMPCKTTVFAGDHIFLNSLQYRQMSGRAGRRGFDLLGHVIFFGLPQFKIHRLLTSSLSRLQGHFPLSTSLVLRLMSMYALSSPNNKRSAEEALLAMLHQPLFSLGKEHLSNQMSFHFRFVLDFLIRERLLNDNGDTFGLTAIAALLFVTEPANLVLSHLFNTGVLHKICEPVDVNSQEVPESVLDKLVFVLSHFFFVRLLPPDFQHDASKDISSVVLEPLPDDIQKTIQEYDKRTLDAFGRYVRSFCRSSKQDEKLPCSSVQILKEDSSDSVHSELLPEIQASGIATVARSPFAALSGKGDVLESVHDMTSSLQQNIYLDRSAIPASMMFSQQSGRPVLKNAYLLDFWRFSNVTQLVKANRINADTVWYLIHDFNHVLRILSIALEKIKSLPSENEDSDDEYEDEHARKERVLPPYIKKLIIAFQTLSSQFNEKFYAAFGMSG